MSTAYSPIPELNQLKEFEDALGEFYYAEGFFLMDYNPPDEFSTWSEDPTFTAGLIAFAKGNDTGSVYALWRVDDRADLATLPVVVFGDEGGELVVARSLLELFQLLAFDTEVTVSYKGEVYYYRDPDEPEVRHSPGHEAYVAWLSRTFGLAPVDDTDAVIAAAQGQYAEAFKAWKAQYWEA
jgi:hypothetical protein